MHYSFIVMSLIGMLTGGFFRASALVILCMITFIGTLITLIVMEWSIWAALATAFALTFALQVFYIIGALLVYGKAKLVARLSTLTRSQSAIPRRAGKTATR
jgi:hypothetical protein